MEVSIQNKEGLNAVLAVKITKEDYQPMIDKALNNYRKKMTLPGFRPGQVPIGIVKKMIEKDVKREEIDKLLHSGINDYIKNNEIKLILSPLSTYIVEDIDWKGDAFEFTYDVGLKPDIKIDFNALNSLTKYNVAIEEGDIEQEIENLRNREGKSHTEDAVIADDDSNIGLVFKELDEEGLPFEGGTEKTKILKYAELPDGLKTAILGKAKGETVRLNLPAILSAEEIGEVLDLDDLTVKDLNADFDVEITNIFKIEPAEVNQDFFNKFFEKDLIKNEDDFKTEWKKILDGYYNNQANGLLEKAAKDEILVHTKVELPGPFLRKYLLSSYNTDKEAEVENFGAKVAEFEIEMKWHLIAEDIFEKNEMEVNEQEIMSYTMAMINSEFNRAGYPDFGAEFIKNYATKYLTQDDNRNRITLSLRDHKVLEQIRQSINPVQETVSVKAFEEIRKQNTVTHNH